MTDKGASDLHLKPMRPPLLRIHGRLMPIEADPLQPTEIEEMVLAILTPSQKTQLEERMALDLGHGVPGLARFRGNIYRQRGTLAAAFRRIPYEIRDLEDLELPESLGELCELPMGLVLVTGPTGSGKSTTLAALVRKIAKERSVHLITIEDPIEYLFADEVASISQREIGTDTPGFLARPAQRHATGSRRHHGRRDARSRDGGDGDHRRRDRPSGLLDAAHQQRHPDDRSHPGQLPQPAAEADPAAARANAQGSDLDAAGGAAGWRGPDRGAGDPACHAAGRPADRGRRHGRAARRGRELGGATTRCRR